VERAAAVWTPPLPAGGPLHGYFLLALLLAMTLTGLAADQPDLTTVKADFAPGEKTLFYDDFTDMAGDEPPPHWRVRRVKWAVPSASSRHRPTGFS
jgi:hypothetical protein